MRDLWTSPRLIEAMSNRGVAAHPFLRNSFAIATASLQSVTARGAKSGTLFWIK